MIEKTRDLKFKKHLQTVINTAGLLFAQVKCHMDSSLIARGLLKSEVEKNSIYRLVRLCLDMFQDQAEYSGVKLIFQNDGQDY